MKAVDFAGYNDYNIYYNYLIKFEHLYILYYIFKFSFNRIFLVF